MNTVVIVDQTNIVVTETSVSDIVFTDIGVQGMKGAQGPIGPPLEFNLLTEEQKIELRGDVGDTSTNYTNLFNSVLLS